ncbi:D-alanyl-D-alanine carboxypeptidase [Streptomyces sp. NPDC004959]|uniref:D-alanyl-D-alanine carboxypeptidase n=1 Tax=Streptomyces sp. NPDC004959 TaxID=3154673 RepID=UPI0033ADC5E2
MAGESPDRAQEQNTPEGSARTRTTGTGGGIPVSRPHDRRGEVARWVRSADEAEQAGQAAEERAARTGGQAARAGDPAARAEQPAAPAGKSAAKPAGPSWARGAHEDDGKEPGGTGATAREAESPRAGEPPVREEAPEPETAEKPAERRQEPGEEPERPAEAAEREAAEPEMAEREPAAEEPDASVAGPERTSGAKPAPGPKPTPEPKPATATRGLSFHKVDTPTTSLSLFGVVRPPVDHTTTVLKLPDAEPPSSKLSDAPKRAAGKAAPEDAAKRTAGKAASEDAPETASPTPSGAPASSRPAESVEPAGALPDEEPPAERTSTFVPLRPLDDARPAALRPKGPRAADKDAEKAPGEVPAKTPGKAGKKQAKAAPAAKPGAKPSDATAAKSSAAGRSSESSDADGGKSSPFGAGYTASQPDNTTAGSTPSSASPTTPASITAEIPAGTAIGAEETRQQPMPPKAPLDLLAELTNTPPPPETPMRTVVRRFKIWTPLVLLVVIVLGVVQAVRPLPQPTFSLTAATTYRFSGEAAAMPWPKSGQAAMDVDGLGSFGSSGAQKPVPIASVAKVMTAYLVLRDHPVKKGSDGASITMDKKAEDDAGLSAQNESTVDVHEGQKLSQKEAIEAIMLASANNIARRLARWDAGSEKDFVAKMNKAADELGMKNTTYTDPSGLDKTTVSTAEDQVKLGKVAMKDPLFREVVRMPAYVDSNGKTQTNWNRLVPMNNTVGIKTGTTTAAGGNLLYAATKEVGGTTRTIVGAVLAQPPAPEDNSILTGALNAGKTLIEAAQGTLVAEKIVKKGDVVGTVDDGLGGATPVVAAKDLTAVGWPGLTVRLKLVDDGTALPHEAPAGTKVGVLRAGDGTSSAVEIPVVLRSALSEPGLGAKLTRLG